MFCFFFCTNSLIMVQTGTSNLQDHSATSQPCRKWGVCIFPISSYAATAKWPKWRPGATWWVPLFWVLSLFYPSKMHQPRHRDAYQSGKWAHYVWRPGHDAGIFWLSLNKWWFRNRGKPPAYLSISCYCCPAITRFVTCTESTGWLHTGEEQTAAECRV